MSADDQNDQTTPQANADVSAEGIKLGEEYDKNRAQAAEDRANSSESLGEGRSKNVGAVITGDPLNGVRGTETTFPGAAQRGLADDGTSASGGVIARAAKGLDTGDVTVDDTTWTAQSASGYVPSNAQNVPGQTYSLDELPDPAVVAASGLPAHQIAEGLVVDAVRTDDINSSQERPSDVGTAPQAPNNPSLEAKAGGRAAGRAQAKAGDK
jgi:hypothetical protein